MTEASNKTSQPTPGPAVMRIELLKPIGKHDAGKRINATADDLSRLKLKPGEHYRMLGTLPSPQPSDLAPAEAAAKAENSAAKPQDSSPAKPSAISH